MHIFLEHNAARMPQIRIVHLHPLLAVHIMAVHQRGDVKSLYLSFEVAHRRPGKVHLVFSSQRYASL